MTPVTQILSQKYTDLETTRMLFCMSVRGVGGPEVIHLSFAYLNFAYFDCGFVQLPDKSNLGHIWKVSSSF